ncbi:hypothetical protein XarbCFBP8152_00670 [Xanthomonas arboricola]|nr:hypothetical protein XarbCFBP8152_00670 [Xanthomonas arboricola]
MLLESLSVDPLALETRLDAALSEQRTLCLLAPYTPTISTGPCQPTVAGPYAAWMPRKSLHGRTCARWCRNSPRSSPCGPKALPPFTPKSL